MNAARRLRPFRAALVGGVFTLTLLSSAIALAGEIKFGKEPLDVDGAGKITNTGRGAAVTKIGNIPGEDVWVVNVWAKLDGGAPGPMYIEFFSKWKGTRYQVHSHEVGDYDGGKFWSGTVELEGGQGFNKNTDYSVEIIQINERERRVKLAAASLQLEKVAAPKQDEPQPEPEAEAETDGLSEQDIHDSFAEDGGEQPPATDEPPATKSKKCAVDPTHTAAPIGLLVLFALGLRRRS